MNGQARGRARGPKLREVFARMIGGARQRARRHHQKPFRACDRFQRFELVRRPEARHRRVLAARLQILADGEEIDIRRAKIVHHLHDLFARFAQAHHQSRFGEGARVDLLHPRQQPERGVIARARPHREIEPRHGFEIVIEHVGRRLHHRFDRALLAQEIGRQNLDRRVGRRRADGAHGSREMRRTAVVEIVAVDRGDHHMGEPELGNRGADILGLVGAKRPRQPGLHIAEGAGARAGVAHDHHGRVRLLPALADVGAAGLLAHRVQAMRAHDVARRLVAGAGGRLDANPGRLAQQLAVRPVRLFGMARPGGLGCGIEDRRHRSFLTPGGWKNHLKSRPPNSCAAGLCRGSQGRGSKLRRCRVP